MGMAGDVEAGFNHKKGERGLTLGKSRRQHTSCCAAADYNVIVRICCHYCWQ